MLRRRRDAAVHASAITHLKKPLPFVFLEGHETPPGGFGGGRGGCPAARRCRCSRGRRRRQHRIVALLSVSAGATLIGAGGGSGSSGHRRHDLGSATFEREQIAQVLPPGEGVRVESLVRPLRIGMAARRELDPSSTVLAWEMDSPPRKNEEMGENQRTTFLRNQRRRKIVYELLRKTHRAG